MNSTNNMNYKEFVEEMKMLLENVADEKTKVEIQISIKNNGIEKSGLKITKENSNISPVIYLESLFEQYLNGLEVEQLMLKVIDIYNDVSYEENVDVQNFMNFNIVKDKLAYKIINTERNKELLDEIPHIEILDFSIVLHLLLKANEEGVSTVLVRNEHIEWWNCSKAELFQIAKKNTEEKLKAEFKSMSETIAEIISASIQDNEIVKMSEQDFLYVLTNSLRMYGAGSILHGGILEKIAGKLNDDFYILPSSVHEIIIVAASDTDMDLKELSLLVRTINETQVAPGEVLADNAYYYDRLKKTLADVAIGELENCFCSIA